MTTSEQVGVTAGEPLRVTSRHPERMRGISAGAQRYLAIACTLLAVSLPAQEPDGGRDLLPAERIAALAAPEREAWTRYLEQSRALHARDTAFMNAELRAAGMATMTKATYSAPEFDLANEMSAAWFASDTALSVADAVLTWQTPSGGWSKRTLMMRPRARGQSYYAETDAWHYIPTLDNGATTGQLRFLMKIHSAHPRPQFAEAIGRGLRYLLSAQEPNGCWPQDYPLDGGYHDAITFNDDATVNVLETLQLYASGATIAAGPEERRLAAEAVQRGIVCIVATQVVVQGRRTAWGQQHDPISLEIVPARKYELAGLSGRESAGIMTYLMSLDSPKPAVVKAVHAAADWFRATRIMGYDYDYRAGLTVKPGAGPIWARLMEPGSNRPIFSNRDGVRLYDWNQLTDRRSGYAWYGTEPASALKKYDRWARNHPRAASSAQHIPIRK